MKVLTSQKSVIQENIKGARVTIGSFDGVHLGHKFLIEKLKELAVTESLPPGPLVVVTFDPHPAKVLGPTAPPRIFSKQDQIDMFAKMGVDDLYFLPFTPELAQMDAETFARQCLFDLLKPSALVVGYDFAFGKNRTGDFNLLQNMAAAYSCKVLRCEPLKIDGEIVSSTRIREMIRAGDTRGAEKFLGRPFYLKGEVVHGKKLGRTIQVPTANLFVESEIVLAHGVYLCRVHTKSGSFHGLTNVGTNPTVTADTSLKIECYILDFNQVIYGETICLEFLERIREEKKFPNVEVLKKEIQNDIAVARQLISSRS